MGFLSVRGVAGLAGVAVVCAMAGGARAHLLPGAGAGVNTPNNVLPPDQGTYLTPDQVHATYSGGLLEIVLQEAEHIPFANETQRAPDPAVPGAELETFQSQLIGSGTVDFDGPGGNPPQPVAGVLNGPVTTRVNGRLLSPVGLYPTEMLSMQLAGTIGGQPVMIRESPTLASTGQTEVTPNGDGTFHIDSFFDVFTELSLDGGASWIPQSDGPTHVQLEPEPGSAALILGGLGALLTVRRRRQ